jgi:hypothetical protein
LTIKIVTDSTADLPPQLAKELGITIVPVYVRFGDKVYRDRVDISEDEFYHRLLHDHIHPSTTQPSPQDFVDVYKDLAQQADGIISIHVSSKLSGTYNSALLGKELVEKECPIEVIDSQVLTTLYVALGTGILDMGLNSRYSSLTNHEKKAFRVRTYPCTVDWDSCLLLLGVLASFCRYWMKALICVLFSELTLLGKRLDSRNDWNLMRKVIYQSTVFGLLPSVRQESLKPSIRVFSSKTLVSISASYKNQVDTYRDNQVDTFVEAKEKSASIETDSSVFSFDFQFLVGRAGLEPATP